ERRLGQRQRSAEPARPARWQCPPDSLEEAELRARRQAQLADPKIAREREGLEPAVGAEHQEGVPVHGPAPDLDLAVERVARGERTVVAEAQHRARLRPATVHLHGPGDPDLHQDVVLPRVDEARVGEGLVVEAEDAAGRELDAAELDALQAADLAQAAARM